MEQVTYLKLGGSLITEKKMAYTARPDVIARAAAEIKSALDHSGSLRLIIGHGSGSFGHVPGQKYRTRDGVFDQYQWKGFIEVWNEARALNQIMVDALIKVGLPVMAFPPSAMFIADHGRIHSFTPDPILQAVEHGIIPLVQGDVVFDISQGGTIFSTEDVFSGLANSLPPHRMLMAGVERGVFSDFPACTKLVDKIKPHEISNIKNIAGGSAAVDVTGGMLEKILILMNIIERFPNCQGLIFSGLQPGNIVKALLGETPGTLVVSE